MVKLHYISMMAGNTIAYQVQLTELYAYPEQDRSYVGERHERGQVVADNNLFVVLGPCRRCGQNYGTAQRVRHQVQLLMARVAAHEIDHGRHVVVRPFVDAVNAKYLVISAILLLC